MASLDFEQEKRAFREFYDNNLNLLELAEKSVRTLITQLLTEHEQFETPRVTSRLKAREECIRKFARKYQTELEQEQKEYEIKDYITDLIGVRVICLYEDEIPRIRELLKDNFDTLDETDKSSLLEARDDAFGYKGFHLDVSFNSTRKSLAEYRKFKNLRFEIQIRTIVQDAWSVLDHKIKYKKSIPPSLKRRINRMAALFELSDQEFLHIRNDTRELELEAQTLAQNLQVPQAANQIDAFSLLELMKEWFEAYPFDAKNVDGFAQEIVSRKPEMTKEILGEILKRYYELVNEYRVYQAEVLSNNLNPYTILRHILYLSDRETFRTMLFNLQRATFELWLRSKEAEARQTLSPLISSEVIR